MKTILLTAALLISTDAFPCASPPIEVSFGKQAVIPGVSMKMSYHQVHLSKGKREWVATYHHSGAEKGKWCISTYKNKDYKNPQNKCYGANGDFGDNLDGISILVDDKTLNVINLKDPKSNHFVFTAEQKAPVGGSRMQSISVQARNVGSNERFGIFTSEADILSLPRGEAKPDKVQKVDLSKKQALRMIGSCGGKIVTDTASTTGTVADPATQGGLAE